MGGERGEQKEMLNNLFFLFSMGIGKRSLSSGGGEGVVSYVVLPSPPELACSSWKICFAP